MTTNADAQSIKRRGRPRRNDVNVHLIRELKEEGKSLRLIARELHIGYGTVRRILGRVPPDAPELSQNQEWQLYA